MRRFHQTQSAALGRLTKLIAPRETIPMTEPKEFLINPPKIAIKPIARILGVAIFLVAGLWWLSRPADLTQIENLTSQISESPASSSLSQVVVHVTGDVINPGIVTLTAGSRVIDAINGAGGFAPNADQTNLNLAAHVEDGQLIQVGGEFSQTADSRINLNTATLEQLDTLPGIGPVVASRILEWRKTNNRFSKIDELQEVEGIGPKLFNRIKDSVRI